MNIQQRIAAPVPRFFRKIRNLGIIFASLSATVMGLPLPLPPVVTDIAGYLTVAATVASAISQATIVEEKAG